MNRAEFAKRLSKCSRASITQYLYSECRNDITLRRIETIEFESKGEKLLEDMKKFAKLSAEINIKTDKQKWLEYNEKWEKTNKELDELYNWFSSIESED